MESGDSLFLSLSPEVQRKIDEAFNIAGSASPDSLSPARKKRRLNDVHSLDSGGGFIIEEPVITDIGGGFVVEDTRLGEGGFIRDDEENDETPIKGTASTYLPISAVSTALRFLDLPPDDEQVLSVLRNAASGWNSSESLPGDESGMVSRDDWRSVCAVLLHNDDDEGITASAAGTDYIHEEEESVAASDEYHDPTSAERSETDSGSDSEYVEGPSTPLANRAARARTSTKRLSLSPSPSSSGHEKLTTAQKADCLKAFALFFPPLKPASPELQNQKIMIKDIQRVSKILGEKLKAEEIVEMLEVFSTSPDKSISLADFERMMIATRMV